MFLYILLGDLLDSPLTTETAAPPLNLGVAFAKMLLTFAILILLLCCTYWLIRRIVRMRLQRGIGVPSIEVLEKKMISTKTMLYLIQIEGKKVLLAESHLEVRKLETFTIEEPTVQSHHESGD